MDRPLLVSISCITYNHAPYIRQCLDGFLMQKTDFAFEILIHDDCSTDGTAEIIKEYESQYPDIIKPLYEEENQWVKGHRGSAVFNFPRAKGKYIAICEGDDYWTDPLKLQKQVDFLESNSDYVMCSHHFKVFKQNENLMEDDWYGEISDGVVYDLNSLIHGHWYHAPLTVMFKFDQLCLEEYGKYSNSKDVTLFFHLLKKGKGVMMPETMAVYRIHSGGIWSSVPIEVQKNAEFMNRIGIYEVEESYEAAFFLRNLFSKWIPRSWMLKEWVLMLKSFSIISKHFGVVSTLKLFFLRFFLNKFSE